MKMYDVIGIANLQMLDHVDNFSRAVRVVDEPLVSHVSQLAEGSHEFAQRCFRYIRSVLLEHSHLALYLRILDGVTAEDVAHRSEEVVAKEGKAWAVGKDAHAEVGMATDE